MSTLGAILFLIAPFAMGGLLLVKFPRTRQVRWTGVVAYAISMTLLIFGAMSLVAWVACARVLFIEVLIAFWFMASWRLAWAIWSRTVGRLGQRWLRWAWLRRRQGRTVPNFCRAIPVGRAMATFLIFAPAFFSMTATHRCKLADGPNPLDTFDTKYEAVRIPTTDGLLLDGWFVPEKGATRTILICHGAGANKGNFIWFLGALGHHGYNMMFFDFRAHGASEGRLATWGINEHMDVLAAVDWLKREKPRDAQMIVGLGSSQGAFALALAARKDPRINAVILDSAFTSPRALMRDHARAVPVFGSMVVDYLLVWTSAQTMTDFLHASAEEAIANMGPRPLLVIHGDQDSMMPVEHSQRLFAAATGPKEIWLGHGPHSNIVTTEPGKYAEHVFEFIRRYLLHEEAKGANGVSA